jgi:hypothetical protein
MEPDCSLPCSQELITEPFTRRSCFSKDPVKGQSPNYVWSFQRLFLSGFPTTTLYTLIFYPIHVTSPSLFILFDLIILIVFDEV